MRQTWRRLTTWAFTFLVLSWACFGVTTVAQTVSSGSIGGTVTDDTGATLPGVTVTLTSPALQVQELVKVAETRGEYQFTGLPPGTYRLTYELSGFARLVREEIRVTTGFAARVDAALKVASLAETVTVTGQSPMVDVTNTRGGTTVTRELLVATPTSLTHQDVLLLVGGVYITGPPLTGQIGAIALGANNVNKSYGQSVRTNNEIEGLRAMPGEAPDFAGAEEVDVKTFGNTAETDIPGANIQINFKSGGNEFHGRYTETAQHRRLSSTNVDDALRAQAISAGDAIRYYNDFSADLGGRIIPNKLWFYGAFRDLRNERTQTGFSQDPGPDGTYGTLDDTPARPTAEGNNATVKVSFQATTKHKIVGFLSRNPFDDHAFGSSRTTPYESTTHFIEIPRQAKLEWQGVLSNRLVVNMLGGEAGYSTIYTNREDVTLTPPRLNRETGYVTGAHFSSRSNVRRNPFRWQWAGHLLYDRGAHQLSTGYRAMWGRFEFQAPGGDFTNYQLVYDRVGGVSRQPVEINVKNHPVAGVSRYNNYSAYAQDTWRAAKRVTLNLGLRLERSVAFVPPQIKIPGQFGTAGSFPQVDVGTWIGVAPRLGVALDLFGDGKTVAKGTYGWYNHDFEQIGVDLEFASTYSQNSVTTTTYRWRDQDGNNDYTPGEVNLDTNGPDFLSVAGATNNAINPDLKQAHTHEVTGSLERQLRSTVSLRGLYVYKKVVDLTSTVNVLRPYGVYNRALTRRDPGPDGLLDNADDGGPVVIYDYDPALRGSMFVANMFVNGNRPSEYQSFEITLNKRPSSRWFAFTSFLATKNHRWLTSIAQTPNDENFALDETWDLGYRLAAGYTLPYSLNVSTLYQAFNGVPLQRTNLFRAPDPDGGPSLPSGGTITVRMEPFGASKGESRHIVNLRVAKNFSMGKSRRFTAQVDAFNAFNSNVAYGFTNASGPTFGHATSIAQPRALRIGVGFEF